MEKENLSTDRSKYGHPNTKRKEESAQRKKVFLAAFVEWGTVKKSCELAGVTTNAYKAWYTNDWEFAQAVAEARYSFAESLEDLALERVKNPDKNRGSDVLLLGLLNANMPKKYRPQVNVTSEDSNWMISEWRKVAQEQKAQSPVEGPELSVPVEQSLSEILSRRGNAANKQQEKEG